jgi:hypothetical protein
MDDIDFDDWNRLKKSLESNIEGPNRFLKEGEAWMSLVGKNIGWEQNGTGIRFSRPVLILRVFNNHMFWAVPLSSRQKSLDFYFNFTDPLNQSDISSNETHERQETGKKNVYLAAKLLA